MTEKSLRKLIYKILLEDEMGRFLAKGLERAQALEKGEDFVDTDSKNKEKGVFDKKTISEILKDDLLYKNIIKTINSLKIPKSFNTSLNKKPELKSFFVNARKFLSNKSDYDFLKNKTKKEDLKKFKDDLIDNESKYYFAEIMKLLSKISLQNINLSDSDSEMKEVEYLNDLNLNSMLSENLDEISFSSLKNKISNFFSKKTSQNTQPAPTPSQGKKSSTNKSVAPIKYKDVENIKTLPFGNKSVSSNMVSPFLTELFFEKENGVLKAKQNSAISWMMKNNADFELTGQLAMKSGYDKNNILPTDIIFKGNWNSGEFKGTFASGYFLGGLFNGGVYSAPSVNFMPNKTILEKLKAFKSGMWLSIDGLFGLKFIQFPTKSKSIFCLELPVNSYAEFQTDSGNLYRVFIIKQPKRDDMKFVYNVAKFNKVNKKYQSGQNIEGDYDQIRMSPKEFMFSKKSNAVLFWKKSSYPELSNPVNIKKVTFGKIS